ncbi:hypothetical protein ENBRE01_1591 [Enteropsectra breve]|nr:hypothetical protein ENBRE01_1591 [Enteropsectra breve]
MLGNTIKGLLALIFVDLVEGSYGTTMVYFPDSLSNNGITVRTNKFLNIGDFAQPAPLDSRAIQVKSLPNIKLSPKNLENYDWLSSRDYNVSECVANDNIADIVTLFLSLHLSDRYLATFLKNLFKFHFRKMSTSEVLNIVAIFAGKIHFTDTTAYTHLFFQLAKKYIAVKRDERNLIIAFAGESLSTELYFPDEPSFKDVHNTNQNHIPVKITNRMLVALLGVLCSTDLPLRGGNLRLYATVENNIPAGFKNLIALLSVIYMFQAAKEFAPFRDISIVLTFYTTKLLFFTSSKQCKIRLLFDYDAIMIVCSECPFIPSSEYFHDLAVPENSAFSVDKIKSLQSTPEMEQVVFKLLHDDLCFLTSAKKLFIEIDLFSNEVLERYRSAFQGIYLVH